MKSEGGIGHFLVNSFGDKYLYEVNGSAFDKVGSAAAFKRHFKKDLFEVNSLYVIVGSDSGLLPQYIVKQELPEGSYYIFIEPPVVLERLREIVPKEGFHRKIIMTTVDEWQLRAKEVEFQNFVYLDNLKFSLSFSAVDGRYSDYLDLSNHLQEELQKIRWSLNAELGAELFTLRQLENLPENRVSAIHLQNRFKGLTAIVLGGGPSLDDVLPWVIANRDRLIVIAVSRIARRLLAVDLSPDMIVSVDPNQISFDVSKELLKLWKKTVFVNKYHVVNSLLGQWCGRSLFLGPRVPWVSSLNENTLDAPGPTVTNSAIDLAVKMGVSQILLAGVDLCHSRDGYTHAQGSNERQVGPQLGKGQLWVETNGGWMVETTPDFHFAATQIGNQAVSARQQCRIVNLSENATCMEGVEYLPPDEIRLSPQQKAGYEMIIDLLPPENTEERLKGYKTELSELIRAQNAFREIKRLSIEALNANDAFFVNRNSLAGNRKHRIKMDRIEKKLNTDFADFKMLVKRFGIRGFLKLTQGDQDREWDQDDVEQLGRIYYEAYRDSAGRLLEIVGAAIARLQVRLEEENPQPDFRRLFHQWSEDLQPGRTLVWKANHPDCRIPEEYLERFSILERVFNEILLMQDTVHMNRARNWAQLDQVRGKLQVMFQRHQVESLRHLVNNLTHLEGVEALSLASLGRGYLSELEKKPECAMEEYQHLLDLQDNQQDLPILEDALRRLLSLSLQNGDTANARLIAECMAGISVVYLPFFADLLWLLGEKQTALNSYADYLEKIPDDHAAMIKVGRYYLGLGLVEGAQMMFETILEQDATNAVAKDFLDELAHFTVEK